MGRGAAPPAGAVIVLLAASPARAPWLEELGRATRAGARVVLVTPAAAGRSVALPPGVELHTGLPLDVLALMELVPDVTDRVAVASGSPRLVRSVVRLLQQSGVRVIRTEPFADQ